MAAMNANLSITGRLHNAITKPLFQRCNEITKLIEETSIKELHGLIPVLLESIFGFGAQPGWGLGRVTRLQANDFAALSKFLEPDGPVLKLICRLQMDPFVKYEFPFSCLPLGTQRMIEDGILPMFYAEKLQMTPSGKPYNMLSLDAFELYFFHFTYFLVNPQAQKMASSSNPSDCLYPTLLEIYLNYYLPVNGNIPSSPQFIQSITPHASPLQSPAYRHSPGTPGRSPFSLLRSHQSFASPHSSPAVQYNEHSSAESEISRTQVFLQTTLDFWLNQCSLDPEKFSVNHQNTAASFLPSGDHIRVVRMMIKHLHYFANSAKTDGVQSAYSSHVHNPLEEFKRCVILQYVQKKMYTFLKHTFERWPLDASFRLMLETWLSYIQPWRYTDPSQSNREKETDARDKNLDEKWRGFIAENLLFYTELFHSFLHRCFRMDLSSPKNAYMLFRVTKVLNIPNLRDMIEFAETALFEPVHRIRGHSADLGASYLSTTTATLQQSNILSMITMQFNELEGAGFQYKPMFSEQSIQQVVELLQLVEQAKKTAFSANKHNIVDNGNGVLGMLGFGPMVDFNASKFMNADFDEFGSGGDVRKLEIHLDQASTNLCKIFQIEPVDASAKQVTWGTGDDKRSQLLSPDTFQDEDGPKLSPLGRYQLMNGLRKFDIAYHGDPELQPIRSYENKILVRMLYALASYFNEKYEEEFNELYNRNDFVGCLAQQILSPPKFKQATPDKALSPMSARQKQHFYQPKLRLRWLASYQTLCYLAALYVMAYFFWSIGPLTFFFLVILAGFMWCCLKALISSPKNKSL